MFERRLTNRCQAFRGLDVELADSCPSTLELVADVREPRCNPPLLETLELSLLLKCE